MPWPKTCATHYHAQCAIKELVVLRVLINLIPQVFGHKRRYFAPLSYPGLLDLTLEQLPPYVDRYISGIIVNHAILAFMYVVIPVLSDLHDLRNHTLWLIESNGFSYIILSDFMGCIIRENNSRIIISFVMRLRCHTAVAKPL